jgi:hypothetical protein
VDIAEILAACGLVEAGVATVDEWKRLIRRHAGLFSFDPDTRHYCMMTIPAPWARHAGTNLADGRRHAAQSTARDRGAATGASGPATLHISIPRGIWALIGDQV